MFPISVPMLTKLSYFLPLTSIITVKGEKAEFKLYSN